MDRETDFGFNGGKAATRTILSQKWGLSPFLVYAQTQPPPLASRSLNLWENSKSGRIVP